MHGANGSRSSNAAPRNSASFSSTQPGFSGTLSTITHEVVAGKPGLLHAQRMNEGATPSPVVGMHVHAWSLHAAHMAQAAHSYAIDGFEEMAPSGIHRELLARDLATVRLGEVDFPILPEHGVVARAAMTACALAPLDVTPGTVIGDESAAWIYCGGESPNRIVVNARERLRVPHTIRARQIALDAEDVIDIAGCPVMRPERAFAELLSRADNPVGIQFAKRLVHSGWVLPADLRARAGQIRRRRRYEVRVTGVKNRYFGCWGPRRYLQLAKTAERLLAEQDE